MSRNPAKVGIICTEQTMIYGAIGTFLLPERWYSSDSQLNRKSHDIQSLKDTNND